MLATRIARTIAALCATGVMALSPTLVAWAADPQCGIADALAAAHRLSEARTSYGGVPKGANGLPIDCVIAGLTSVGDARRVAVTAYEDGQTLAAQGNKDAARAKYVEALQ